jgi:hypothetical protein
MNRYPSDLKDKEWKMLEPLIPQPTGQGRPREYPWRELVNAMFYIVRSGCAWRMIRVICHIGSRCITISDDGAKMEPGKESTPCYENGLGKSWGETNNRVLVF